MNHKVERVDNLMYKGCESHWHCTKCDNYWPFHCYTNTQLENMECGSTTKDTLQLYDYCNICGRRIVVGETHYDLVNGETICTNCCKKEK